MLNKEEKKQLDDLLKKKDKPLRLFCLPVTIKDGMVHIGCRCWDIEGFKLVAALLRHQIKLGRAMAITCNDGTAINVPHKGMVKVDYASMYKGEFLVALDAIEEQLDAT